MNSLIRLFSPALLGLTLAATPVVAQQSTGIITGTVTEGTATGRPVSDAQVVVTGTGFGARTDLAGRFRIGGVPAGTVTVRVARIGYQGATQAVTVTAGSTSTANFALAAATTVLNQVTITAAGTESRRRESGAAVDRVTVDSLPLAPIQSFSELLTGRTPGVVVEQSSGTTGTGARVRIRGANSVSLSNEPLLIIDGVRITNETQSTTIGVGGQSPSRLNDLNPEDIESYDVIKGPAAAALYGTAAANGVIQITTKQGRAGRTNFNAFSELGGIEENNQYPPNYGAYYTRRNGSVSPFCNLIRQSNGECTIDSLAAFNTLEETHPFRYGRRQKLGASLSGGGEGAAYYLSGADEKESGVYRTSNLDRLFVRANASARPSSQVDVHVATGYTRSNLQLPQNDNNYYGVISNGLAGLPFAGEAGYAPIPPSQFENIFTAQHQDRFTGGATANWRPLSWLTGTATVGVDVADRQDAETLQPLFVFFGRDSLGHRSSNRTTVTNTTSNFALSARNAITTSINSLAQVGFQYQREQLQGTFGYGNGLVAGTGSLNGVTGDLDVGESNIDNKTQGGFLSEQLAWNEKLYLTGTLRGDKNSAFGKSFKFAVYPSASASYVVTEGGTTLSNLRVRAAYGQSGLRPSILDALQYFQPTIVRLGGADIGGFTTGGLGNLNLRPEKVRETELGFDAGLFHDVANLQVTYYDKRSNGALIAVPVGPSTGGPTTQFANIGSVRNNGIEVMLSGTLLNTERAVLNLTATAAGNRNRLTSLGGQPDIIFGLNDSQRHTAGYPLGGYWGTTVERVAPNANGTLPADSVFYTASPDSARFLGSVLPTRQGSLTGDLTLFKLFRVTTLFDYRGGNKLYNATEQFRCAIASCRGANDVTAPLAERANAYAAYLSGGNFYGGFIEDASFVKWRELSLTISAPERWGGFLRSRDLSLSLAGRNLHTFTKYKGVDPEVNFAGQSNHTTADFLTQPSVRYYTARINVGF